ncbi:MAG: hypothetical protein V4707_05700 [Pseudomonadota bacterium]
MSDEPEQPLDPFPTAIPAASPFPPLEGEAAEPVTDWVAAADPHDLPTRESKLVALGRFAFPPAPPLDDEGVAARDRRWTSRTIAFLAVFMLIFNAASIQNWSRQQAPGWVTSTVQQLSDVWSTQLTQLGADQPRHAVRTAYDNARAARFPGQPAAQP